MQARDRFDLLLLGALWGASFLFMRIAAPEFGAFALIEVRVATAALILLPVLITRAHEIRQHWPTIALLGVVHYALPFSLFAFSVLSLTGGYSAIINASSPLFASLVAWTWLGERLELNRIAGLAVGMLGVTLLVWDRLQPSANSESLVPAVGAALLAAVCYGVGAVLARKRLANVTPIAVASGSMFVAAAVLLPLALWQWPAAMPSPGAWASATTLGLVCTALAFVVYFRLIASAGPTKAISVTFLVPVFAVLFGTLVIGEALSPSMVVGGAVVLLGTALSSGLLNPDEFLDPRPFGWSRRPSIARGARVRPTVNVSNQ